MGKWKNTAKGGGKAPSSHSPTPSFHFDEAWDPCDKLQDLEYEVASLEEHYPRWTLLPKCPFDLHNVVDHHQNDPYH